MTSHTSAIPFVTYFVDIALYKAITLLLQMIMKIVVESKRTICFNVHRTFLDFQCILCYTQPV
jgi:hypothetical protein